MSKYTKMRSLKMLFSVTVIRNFIWLVKSLAWIEYVNILRSVFRTLSDIYDEVVL